MQYHIAPGVEDAPTISTKCMDADEKENKELIPIFGNNSPDEVLLLTIENIFMLKDRYDWKEAKIKLMFQHFGRALKGEPLRKWTRLTNSQRTFTADAFRNSNTYPTPVNVAQIELVTRYDTLVENVATSIDALTIMENHYSPAGGKEAK